MTLWLDAQISPALAVWLRMRFDLDAVGVRDLGLRDAEDTEIFAAAARARSCRNGDSHGCGVGLAKDRRLVACRRIS